MKRFVVFLTALALLMSACAVGVSAAEAPKKLLALGDSITTGYGLANYSGGLPYECKSYINTVAEALGLEAGKTYVNSAVDGDTSEDLLSMMPLLTEDIKSSDLIVVTIGGNDLLQAIPLVAAAVAGSNVGGLEASVNYLITVAPEKYATLAQNTDFQAKIGAVLGKYASNLAAIATAIKTNAPEARVILVKQYNPMKNVLGFADFGNFADTMIGAINASMDAVAASFGFEVLDAPSVINVNAAGLTNILDLDIHPNAKGHIEMAKLLAKHIGVTLDIAEETTADTVSPPCVFDILYDDNEHWEKCVDCGVIFGPEPHAFDASGKCRCGYERKAEDTTSAPAEPEVTTSADGATEPAPEKSGCFASVYGASVIIACACAVVFIKKKN